MLAMVHFSRGGLCSSSRDDGVHLAFMSAEFMCVAYLLPSFPLCRPGDLETHALPRGKRLWEREINLTRHPMCCETKNTIQMHNTNIMTTRM